MIRDRSDWSEYLFYVFLLLFCIEYFLEYKIKLVKICLFLLFLFVCDGFCFVFIM